MNKTLTLKTTLAFAALLALPLAQAATMSKPDYKVAAERCEALAGDSKGACIVGAKARFGKT